MSTGEDTLLSNVKEGAFSSPGGGGMTFGGNFSPDGRINDSDENEEQFRRASDSMFKEGNDFMTNQDNTWIQPSGNNLNNPFLPDMSVTHKPDSGFISPACNSSNKSSDEDRKEDEEFLESQEVSKLLGGRPMEELLSRNTPTPPVDETGSSLEEILAAARDNPDSVGEVDDDDSDESSADDSKPPLKDNNSISNQAANQNVSDSDENDEGDFTYMKEESQVQDLLADVHGGEGNNIDLQKSIPSELSNGHKEVVIEEEEDGEGPSSVIIETQEAPNPDSASFILKTTNSEAPELPSPQEPVVEVIMEPEGVGNQSPILEEVEEEDHNSIASPHKDIGESSELECGKSDEVTAGHASSAVSFQCTDEEVNFMLKTPNPSDMLILSEDDEGPQPCSISKSEESVNIRSDNNIEKNPKKISNEHIENDENKSSDAHIDTSADDTSFNKPSENEGKKTSDVHIKNSTEETSSNEPVDNEAKKTSGALNETSTEVTGKEPVANEVKKTSDAHIEASGDGTSKESTEKDSRENEQNVMEGVVEDIIEIKVNCQIGINAVPPPTIHIQDNNESNDDELVTNNQSEVETDPAQPKSEDEIFEKQPLIPEDKDGIIEKELTSGEVISNFKIEDDLSDRNVLEQQEQPSSDEIVKPDELSGGSETVQELIHVETQNDEVPKEVLDEEPIIKSESTTVASSLVEVSEELIKVAPQSENLEALSTETMDNASEVKEEIVQKEVIQNEENMVALDTSNKEENNKTVAPESKKTEVTSPSPSKTSSKKEVKPGAAVKKSTPSNVRSATSSPKKTAVGSSSASSVKSTVSKRPASSGKVTSAPKSTPKTATQTTKPSSASKAMSSTRNPMSAPSKVSSTRPSSAKSNPSSSLTKKPIPSTSKVGSTSATSRLTASRTSSGDVKSRVESTSKKETISRVGSSTSKPSSRLGTTSKSSSLAASNKSNGTSSTTSTTTTRKPLVPRTTATSSTLSKSKLSSESASSKVGAKSGTTTRSSLQGKSAVSTNKGSGVGLKKPTNVSAKVSTGLTRPKSSLKTAKPTENGATSTSSPKASPLNGNTETPKEVVP